MRTQARLVVFFAILSVFTVGCGRGFEPVKIVGSAGSGKRGAKQEGTGSGAGTAAETAAGAAAGAGGSSASSHLAVETQAMKEILKGISVARDSQGKLTLRTVFQVEDKGFSALTEIKGLNEDGKEVSVGQVQAMSITSGEEMNLGQDILVARAVCRNSCQALALNLSFDLAKYFGRSPASESLVRSVALASADLNFVLADDGVNFVMDESLIGVLASADEAIQKIKTLEVQVEQEQILEQIQSSGAEQAAEQAVETAAELADEAPQAAVVAPAAQEEVELNEIQITSQRIEISQAANPASEEQATVRATPGGVRRYANGQRRVEAQRAHAQAEAKTKAKADAARRLLEAEKLAMRQIRPK